jgi:hypothetical protein
LSLFVESRNPVFYLRQIYKSKKNTKTRKGCFDSATSFGIFPGCFLSLDFYFFLDFRFLVKFVEIVDDDRNGEGNAQHAANGASWKQNAKLSNKQVLAKSFDISMFLAKEIKNNNIVVCV